VYRDSPFAHHLANKWFQMLEQFSECLNSIRSIGRNLLVLSKEKDDEENCEYEMIFDAEGSMHLVKKATTQPNSEVRFRISRKVRVQII